MKNCEYCGNQAQLVKGAKIYPHRPDLYHKDFYYCDNGHEPAYVGCHRGTIKPLGRLADKELRSAKSRAHAEFDPMWRDKPSYFKSRGKAYNWLANKMKKPSHETHIGMFNIEECEQVIKHCNDLFNEIDEGYDLITCSGDKDF